MTSVPPPGPPKEPPRSPETTKTTTLAIRIWQFFAHLKKAFWKWVASIHLPKEVKNLQMTQTSKPDRDLAQEYKDNPLKEIYIDDDAVVKNQYGIERSVVFEPQEVKRKKENGNEIFTIEQTVSLKTKEKDFGKFIEKRVITITDDNKVIVDVEYRKREVNPEVQEIALRALEIQTDLKEDVKNFSLSRAFIAEEIRDDQKKEGFVKSFYDCFSDQDPLPYSLQIEEEKVENWESLKKIFATSELSNTNPIAVAQYYLTNPFDVIEIKGVNTHSLNSGTEPKVVIRHLQNGYVLASTRKVNVQDSMKKNIGIFLQRTVIEIVPRSDQPCYVLFKTTFQEDASPFPSEP